MSEQKGNESYDAAYQGAPGAFSEEAALHLTGPTARFLPCEKFEEVFSAVETSAAKRGVAPIENTLAGSVHACYDLLATRDLTIIGETILHISHTLIAAPGVAFAAVRKALSHPVALAQCEGFFRRNPQIEPVPVYDTAGAVEQVVRGSMIDSAAIASRRSAGVYGGVVLEEAIQDHQENYTRFLLLSKHGRDESENLRPPGSGYKTMILLRTANRPGTLFEALGPLAQRGIDLAKIESRPLRGSPFEYLFYLDLIGDAREEKVAQALDDLRRHAISVRVLGSFPRFSRPLAATET